ncbi:MAG TPA: hypothetical protein VFY27_06685 [Woeseiaceae bacterium]|nr:hypothetical protein [Woeseiaceae bacterium]
MNKKRDLDNIDMDESTYELLGSKLSKLAGTARGKERFRERRPNDRQESYAPAAKVKRMRDRPED